MGGGLRLMQHLATLAKSRESVKRAHDSARFFPKQPHTHTFRVVMIAKARGARAALALARRRAVHNVNVDVNALTRRRLFGRRVFLAERAQRVWSVNHTF
jgi:hypothetical protein